MKIIDLLNKIAKNEEVPKKICYEEYIWTWNGETYDNREQCLFEDYIDKKYVITDVLNDEIEIIEQETTYEQNFTGWKMFQSGKVVCSYDCDRPALKPVDIADVEKDVKEMLKENPKKIEELELVSLEEFKTMTPAERYHVTAIEYDRINDLTKAVNYLLEKESDK